MTDEFRTEPMVKTEDDTAELTLAQQEDLKQVLAMLRAGQGRSLIEVCQRFQSMIPKQR